MDKRALLVGIDDYKNVAKLEGCVNDVRQMEVMLERHEDKSPNYECKTLEAVLKLPKLDVLATILLLSKIARWHKSFRINSR